MFIPACMRPCGLLLCHHSEWTKLNPKINILRRNLDLLNMVYIITTVHDLCWSVNKFNVSFRLWEHTHALWSFSDCCTSDLSKTSQGNESWRSTVKFVNIDSCCSCSSFSFLLLFQALIFLLDGRKFWPSQRPLFIFLDPGRRRSSF
jgi:hypothetical protein